MRVIDVEKEALRLIPLKLHSNFMRTSRQSINRPVTSLCLSRYKHFDKVKAYSDDVFGRIIFGKLTRGYLVEVISVTKNNQLIPFTYYPCSIQVPEKNTEYEVEFQYVPSFGWDNDELPIPEEITMEALVLAVIADFYETIDKEELSEMYTNKYRQKLKRIWRE